MLNCSLQVKRESKRSPLKRSFGGLLGSRGREFPLNNYFPELLDFLLIGKNMLVVINKFFCF